MKSEQLFEKFGQNRLGDILDIDISSSSKLVFGDGKSVLQRNKQLSLFLDTGFRRVKV